MVARLVPRAFAGSWGLLADASGAELCRNPGALASALRKIAGAPAPVASASPTCAALYISNPTKKRPAVNWFSTHPPVEERIRRLEQMM
ncbi:MAG: hypothetical protein DIU83_02110 [Bacillota bacterium]|nr:MAG: hypothetical protein DIU83_02110 [Bacillota bacterium]